MANRKTRQKSKKKGKDEKLSTGRQNKRAMRLDGVDKVKFLSPDERKQYLIENGHLIQDKVFNELALKKGKFDKQALAKKPNKLISKGGKLGSRRKHTKYMDSILMSELLINATPSTKRDNKSKPSSGDNNNDNDLSDQNNSVNRSRAGPSAPKKPNVCGETNDSTGTQNNGDVAPSTAATYTSSPEESQTTATNEAQNKNKQKYRRHISKTKKIMAQRLEQLKKVKLSNGVSVSMTNFECDNCKCTFNLKASLQRHMLTHLNLKPLSCPHCPAAFRQRGNWRVHMASAHPEEFKKVKYMCRMCKKSFHTLEHLKLHRKAHSKERYKCAFCETDFKSRTQLTQHEKHHMVPGRYKCNMCTLSYDTRSLYSAHLKAHAKMKDYACQYCGKSYLRPSSISRHIRVSHGGMRMQCPVCKKLLRGHLSEHMRTHENDRPHECDVCGQKFTQSTQLTVHKRSHSGVRPYLCRICNQPFSHSNALMLHIRRHTGEKPFECAMCPQTFSQVPHMKAHMRSIHRKTEFYKCNNCNAFFKLKALLEAHTEECGDDGGIKKDKASEGTKEETLVSRLRFLLALLFTMIASKEKLYDLGFNKRLIDDILVDSIEAMGLVPKKDRSLPALSRLRVNALMLLQGTVPKNQMDVFVKENKTTEQVLELLTDDHNKK